MRASGRNHRLRDIACVLRAYDGGRKVCHKTEEERGRATLHACSCEHSRVHSNGEDEAESSRFDARCTGVCPDSVARYRYSGSDGRKPNGYRLFPTLDIALAKFLCRMCEL